MEQARIFSLSSFKGRTDSTASDYHAMQKEKVMVFTRKYLVDLAGDSTVYYRGVDYYNEKRVKSINVNGTEIRSTVKGARLYNTYMEVAESGEELEDFYCSCPAYDASGFACKHIVATLLSLGNVELGAQRSIFRQSETLRGEPEKDTFRTANRLLDIFTAPEEPEDEVEDIDVEVYIEEDDSIGAFHYLRLRTGSHKLLFEKNLDSFLRAYGNGTYQVKGPYKRLLDYLYGFYEADHNAFPSVSPGASGARSLRGDKFILTPHCFGRVLHILEGETVFFTNPFIDRYKGVRKEAVVVTCESPEVAFEVSDQTRNLEMRITGLETYTFLSKSPAIFYRAGRLCIAPKSAQQAVISLLEVCQNNEESKFLIPNDIKEDFLSSVVPELRKTGSITFDETLRDNIVKEDLRPEVYLDFAENNITATLKFQYGPYTVRENNNTTVKDELGTEVVLQDIDKIIIRDYKREASIMAIFEDYDFRINRDHMYLDQDDMIYDFIHSGLVFLMEKAEVYYSEAFERISVKRDVSPGISVSSGEDMNFLDFTFDLPEGITTSELLTILKESKSTKKYHRLKDGSFVNLENRSLDILSNLLGSMDIKDKDILSGNIRLPKYRSLFLEEALKDAPMTYSRDRYVREMADRIKNPKDLDLEVPDVITGTLRDYQKVGYKWLKILEAYGFSGILADDMGLGKTLQVITLLSHEKERTGLPSLVVAPTSLVYNWKAEIAQFNGNLKALIIDGLKGKREELLAGIEDYDIVITSYPLIRNDQALYADLSFNYVILDEAQHIKNPVTSAAKSVKSLNALHRLAMTGTPIENTLTELWSIFDFLMPGYLYSHKKFVERYEKPIIMENDEKALKSLISHVRPFILRRIKKDVLKELPDKIETRLVVEMGTEQKKVYLAKLEEAKAELKAGISETGFARNHIKILSLLTRLRQTCCHPSLLMDHYKGGSAKLDALMELLDESLKGGHKVLIFSQFTSMLAIIQKALRKSGYDYLYLDGSVVSKDRMDLVNAFQNREKDIFLISLKAGGTGLNLTEADIVIHFDPWWNPAVEEQATDRAHRIGQSNRVQVYKFVTSGTIEEKIIALQDRKKNIIDSVIKPGETMLNKLSEHEIEDLFEIG